MKILVTGVAGFIGFHLANRLINRGDEVIGLDNINQYYDVRLKYKRLAQLGINENDITLGKVVKSLEYQRFSFVKLNLEDGDELKKLFEINDFQCVCNLAAQAGVRYSLENPFAYINSNIVGFMNIIECCKKFKVGHLVYASSSSVYGSNTKMPLSTKDIVDHPVSLYAATKKSNELIAHSYSHLYNLRTTGLRFFTVYGPWGRPDMALFLFIEAILQGKPIKVFNNGNMVRDFTYIDDIIDGIEKVVYSTQSLSKENLEGIRTKNTYGNLQSEFYKVYNLGNSNPIMLMDYIDILEKYLGRKAIREFLPLQPGDVVKTEADISDFVLEFNYRPSTTVEEGIGRFVDWYMDYVSTIK